MLRRDDNADSSLLSIPVFTGTLSAMIPGKKCYGVSEITTLIREMLEDEFTGISVEGEISNFRPSSTGHFYFSLKDEHALISVVMFKGRTGRLNFKPTDGLKVRAEGNLSVYAKRGVYQLICEHMVPAGEGELLAQLEQLQKELAAIGVFDEERKKPLPLFPTRIGPGPRHPPTDRSVPSVDGEPR